jgi:hypothetical protein
MRAHEPQRHRRGCGHSSQGARWKELRLNFAQHNLDAPNGETRPIWRPDWQSDSNVAASPPEADNRYLRYPVAYGKPVIYDECKFEGDIPKHWGSISAQELVRRFWLETVSGAYVGPGETYLDPNQTLWWSKGGAAITPAARPPHPNRGACLKIRVDGDHPHWGAGERTPSPRNGRSGQSARGARPRGRR